MLPPTRLWMYKSTNIILSTTIYHIEISNRIFNFDSNFVRSYSSSVRQWKYSGQISLFLRKIIIGTRRYVRYVFFLLSRTNANNNKRKRFPGEANNNFIIRSVPSDGYHRNVFVYEYLKKTKYLHDSNSSWFNFLFFF